MTQTVVPPLAVRVRDAAGPVVNARLTELATELNRFINTFVGPGFIASSGAVRNTEGNTSARFAAVVHTADGPSLEAGAISADGTAVVIDAVEVLDETTLRDAYHRVVHAKHLKKAPRPMPDVRPGTRVTLGIIFSLRSPLAIDSLAQEMERLNAETTGEDRPDMVVVASTGVIQYAVQFPGEGIGGDMLPPADGALAKMIPPWYIVMVVRPSGDFTLNRMLALILAHLGIFAHGVPMPQWNEVLAGTNKQALVITGYQYNLAGELRPVPPEFYNDRYLGPRPFEIQDKIGHVLATVRFLPWQDGGALMIAGKLPLEAFLVFLPKKVWEKAGAVKVGSGLISYVLPINSEDFRQMLSRFRRQSNMIVRPVEPSWVVKKVADEGSQSPFIARLMIGVLKLRDIAGLDANARAKFDEPYDVVLTSLNTARNAAQILIQTWHEHARRVAEGQAARLQRNQIHIDETVDRELGRQTDAFLNAAVRALKQGMQSVSVELGINIGFLFQKQPAFEAGVAALRATDPVLADYLSQARQWTDVLVTRRNAVEHEGWSLPDAVYGRTADSVSVTEPMVDGRPVSTYVAFMLDRLLWFVEDVTTYCFVRLFPPEVRLTELKPERRRPEIPERFRPTLAIGGEPVWVISAPTTPFERG